MILNEEKRNEFDEAVKPLMKFLNDNCHPHVTAVVNCTKAELSEGICTLVTDEFVRD